MSNDIEELGHKIAAAARAMNVTDSDDPRGTQLCDQIYELECAVEAAPALDAADAAVKLMIANMLATRIPDEDSDRLAKQDAATALALATQAVGVIPPNVAGAAAAAAAACHLLTHIVRADLTPPWKRDDAARGAALLLADAVLALERDAGVPVRQLGGTYYLTLDFTPAARRRRRRAAAAAAQAQAAANAA